jgi:hypothetical protein
MIRGNKFLNLFKDQSFNFIDSESERKTGFRIAFVQFFVLFTLETVSNILEFNSETEGFNILDFSIHNILYVSFMINITSIISLIAYQSKIVSIQIDRIYANFSPKNLPEIYQFICKTNRFVKKFDSLISSVIFMNLFNSSIICIAYLCLIADDLNDKYFVNFHSITSLAENLFLIITLCYSCDIILTRIKKLTDEIQELFSRFHSSSNDLNQLLMQIKINFIKQEIGFTAFGLIKINSKTIISVFAVILSYSVVIIQTSYRQGFARGSADRV